MILDIGFETMPREDLEAIILRRLKATVDRVYANVPFYRKRFEENHITPNDIQSLDDLKRIPFTTKEDLRDNYPFGMFAVPMENVVRIHASSGTIIPLECLRFPWKMSFAFMPHPGPPESRLLWGIRLGILIPGPSLWPVLLLQAGQLAET